MIGTHFFGRLGNNMYQYAYIRSVAERKNYEFCIHSKSSFDQFNDIFPHLKFNRDLNYHYQNFIQEVNYDFKESLYDISDNTFVSGFFQNHNYFELNNVRKWFEVYLNDQQNQEYNYLLNFYNPDDYCYINFRGKDFIDVPVWREIPEYFINAQKIVKDKKFLVITDDITNAKLNIKADGYIDPNYKIALKLMIQSKQIIIPRWTTFAWWGAYLSYATNIIAPDIENISYIKNDRFNYIKIT